MTLGTNAGVPPTEMAVHGNYAAKPSESSRIGWLMVALEDCVDILDSKRVPINSEERDTRKGEVPYYGATGQVGWIDDFIFDEELVLLGEDGAPFLEPSKHKAYKVSGKSWVNNHAHVLRAINGITINSFLCHYLNSFDFHGYVTGTTRFKLNQAPMRKIPVPLPPLPEQHRIVAKIEELFSDLDAGVESLKKAKVKLKRYRQSVLKAACEGKLVPTEAELAKAEGRDYEPADVLLSRILEKRRQTWEAGQKAGKGGNYVKPEGPDTASLPELPEGWCWTSIHSLADTIGGVTKGRDLTGKKTIALPYLRVANVQRGWLDLSEIKEIEVLVDEKAKYRLLENDLLLTEGGDRDKLGRSVVWKNQIANMIHQNHIFRARPYLPELPSYWMMYCINSESGQKYFNSAAKQTTNLASINLTQLKACPIPLPPIAEQYRIVSEVERRFSIADEMEKAIGQSLKQADRLRQSILKRAFEGKLVSQDPNDEPSETLLARKKQAKSNQDSANWPKPSRKNREKALQMELI